MSRPELPGEGLWNEGHGRRGRSDQQDNSEAEAGVTAEVQRAERIALWGDLWRRVEDADAALAVVEKELVKAQAALAALRASTDNRKEGTT